MPYRYETKDFVARFVTTGNLGSMMCRSTCKVKDEERNRRFKHGLVRSCYPPYMSNLTPSDYILFPEPKEHLLGKDLLQTMMPFVL